MVVQEWLIASFFVEVLIRVMGSVSGNMFLVGSKLGFESTLVFT